MSEPALNVPVSLLLAPDLTPAAKVLWMAQQGLPADAPPTKLAAAAGLTLPTVRLGRAQLFATGWYSRAQDVDGRAVTIPLRLLADPEVSPRAKLLYGLLQALPGYRHGAGACSITVLAEHAQVNSVTARAALRSLVGARWVQTTQEGRKAPIRFTLCTPESERMAAAIRQAARRLERAKQKEQHGEGLMHEYLSLLIDCDEFTENARLGFLVNPLTQARLELDRYYPPGVAFEFHGLQHFRVTARFPSEAALREQQARDLMKEALCARRGIHLVIVREDDLTLAGMQAKIGHALPRRDLRGYEELIQFLARHSAAYRW